MDKAAPIPGGNKKLSMGFVKKHKKMAVNTLIAYKFLNRYFANFNKKRNKKQYKKTNRDIRNSADFSALMQMDSLFHSSMRKTALLLKPQDKSVSSSYFLNGKYVITKNFALYRSTRAIQKDGDFCIGQSSLSCAPTLTLLHQLHQWSSRADQTTPRLHAPACPKDQLALRARITPSYFFDLLFCWGVAKW